MALILCIETGTDTCSVALARDGALVGILEDASGRDHARKAGAFAGELLAGCGEVLDAVAVGMGPGSYTGLRIGVSLAKGLCYGLGVPLIGVSSLEALAVEALATLPDIDPEALLCPMIDARRMEVYAQVFDTGLQALTPVEAHIIDKDSFAELRMERPFVVFGDGAAKCVEAMGAPAVTLAVVRSSARGMIAPAHRAWDEKRFEDLAYCEPFYLKDFLIK